MPKPMSPGRFATAFTLVELLVSIGVLAALVLLVSRMTSSTAAVTVASSKHMDADSHVRMIFDRMATDFSKMLKRKDVDYIFTKQNGNDAMWFYTEAPAYFTGTPASSAKSSLSLAGYRINSAFQLERLGKGLEWDGVPAGNLAGSAMFLTYPIGSTAPNPASTLAGNWPSTVTTTSNDPDYNVLSEQTYRLEYSFQLRDGTLSVTAPTTGTGLQTVSAIVVAIAVLDNTSRSIVKKSATDATIIDSTVAAQMINALPDSVTGSSIAQTWNSSSYLTSSGIPQLAASQIRIYQRHFYLNTK